MIVGVGGQGVIMVSKVLALLGQSQGFEVKQSEVHGMAKRGGTVFSHVRFGQRVWSPTIPKGEADVLIALEWAEGLRWLPFLKPDTGMFICDTSRIVPPFACRNRHPGAPLRYAKETPAEVIAHVARRLRHRRHRAWPNELGNERAANVVLLGALSTALEFPVADWERTRRRIRAEEDRHRQPEAFRRGRAWIEEARTDPRRRSRRRSRRRRRRRSAPIRVRLEINPAWCKSCDICVKLCPERCLRLDADRIAELAAAGQMHRLPRLRMAVPGFRHLACTSTRVRRRARPMNAVDTALTGKNAAKLISGNHACALGGDRRRLPLLRRLSDHAVLGNRRTPVARVAEVDGVFVQMEDEIASMAAVIGASMGGVKAMTATSGPGFSLKQENIGYAAGAEIPCVIVNVMRGGPSTGMPTRPAQADIMQARWGSHGDYPIIVLAPASVREIYSETIRAFDLAETTAARRSWCCTTR